MHRLSLLVVGLFASVALAQPSFPEPKTFPPDDATLKEIATKTAELKAAIEAIEKLPPKPKGKVEIGDVSIYLKAAEWIVRHKEWYSDKSGKQTLDVLATGLARAKAAKEGQSPWMEARGTPIARGYHSMVDQSVQPYSIQYPAVFDPKKKYRLDIVLHGRDGTLTEVKFLAAKEAAKADPKLDHFVLEVYGRGNNAYRWAGETDITEVISAVKSRLRIDQIVLRGFSMGGAGTWHYGLHHLSDFSVIGPGAGFTTTRGYIKNLKEPLPEYIDKCLHIYDAVDYAENAFGVPVVAYSGEKDPQKAAADNIEKILKDFKEPHTFKHLVAPGLEHQQPAAWMAKCDAQYREILAKEKNPLGRVRFVTYTSIYYKASAWLWVMGLDEQYAKAVIDAKIEKGVAIIETSNVRRVVLNCNFLFSELNATIRSVLIDGQKLDVKPDDLATFVKVDGKWSTPKGGFDPKKKVLEKKGSGSGPIDIAFMDSFVVVRPSAEPWHKGIADHTGVVESQFAALWDKHMRGKLPVGKYDNESTAVLFGDPASNPEIAKVLPGLPIQWTKDELVVNGVTYDSKTHYPALTYPDPDPRSLRHIVLNSGHTFKDADFRGTNALLYPRLGDWAVLKPKPTRDDPGAVEVVAAGIFDEFWQFKKEKK